MAQPELDRLIISNLADLDAAAQYVYDELHPALAKSMDTLVEAFLRDSNWSGAANWSDKNKDREDIWLAPEEWRRQAGRAASNFQCQFTLARSLGKEGLKDVLGKDVFWLSGLPSYSNRSKYLSE
jgi:hypothetical protein